MEMIHKTWGAILFALYSYSRVLGIYHTEMKDDDVCSSSVEENTVLRKGQYILFADVRLWVSTTRSRAKSEEYMKK